MNTSRRALQSVAPRQWGGALADRFASVRAWLRLFIATPGRAVQLARYAAASLAALCCDVGVFLSLTTFVILPSAAAAAIGYLAGAMIHYILSIHFVYAAADTGKTHRRLVTEFLATGLLGLALTSMIVWISTDIAGLAPIIGKAISIVVSFLAVYLARTAVVFAVRHNIGAAECT